MKKILFVASEAVPFIKTGGLADVVGSLPKSIDSEYFDVRVILPKYACMKQEWKERMHYLTHFYMDYNWNSTYVGVLELVEDGVQYYFIDNEYYFNQERPYTDDIRWDIERFAYFSKAALSVLPDLDFCPDLVHCHDWQTGLVPAFLKEQFASNPFYAGMKTVFTIHNLKFQGRWGSWDVKNMTGLPDRVFDETYGANLLRAGLLYADAITTVSDTYAEEIKTPYYGEGMDGILRMRSGDLRGIVNGIDYTDFNPDSDSLIWKNYTRDTFRKDKNKNKKALQRELGLPVDEKKMMIGIVSRLTDQKGMDLIACVLDDLCQDEIQLVVLGTGEERYENMFRHFAWKYPDKVAANICYNESLSHKVYASCDAFLMPSLFEPCGLSQLMSLRYGTLPIVRETGGLKDTVKPYNEYESKGTGFSFANYNAHEMLGVIRYAQHVFYNKKREWNKLVDRAMEADFSWKNSANKYQEMYDWLIG